MWPPTADNGTPLWQQNLAMTTNVVNAQMYMNVLKQVNYIIVL